MKGSADVKADSEQEVQGKGIDPGQDAGVPNVLPKAAENNAIFDQAVARIMGSRLGVYDGQDWAGSTPEARHEMGGQMLAEAVRLRESGRLVEGLALATKIGEEHPLEAGEAVGRLRSGIDALGLADPSDTDPTSTDLGQGAPSDASGQPAAGNAPPPYHGAPPSDESQLAGPGVILDHGEQLGFDALAAIEPDDQEV